MANSTNPIAWIARLTTTTAFLSTKSDRDPIPSRPITLNSGTPAAAAPATVNDTFPSSFSAEINWEITAPWTSVHSVNTAPRYQKFRVDTASPKRKSTSVRLE